MSATFLIFGLGYTACALVPKLNKLGFQVVAATRNIQKIYEKKVVIDETIDLFAPNIEEYISKATHILITIPPILGTGDIILSHYADLLGQNSSHIEWLGYLSSTGVYGDHHGEWVDESSSCMPQSQTGVLRLQTEKAWLALALRYQLPLHIFRLAGIYGPGRSALDRIQSGKQFSIYKEGQVFSRIHVEDIVSVLIASMNTITPLSIYNVADDEPAPSHVVDAYAASLLHQEPLPLVDFDEALLSAREKEFYSSNRRVSNLKIKKELNINLQYPSFREGLTGLKIKP